MKKLIIILLTLLLIGSTVVSAKSFSINSENLNSFGFKPVDPLPDDPQLLDSKTVDIDSNYNGHVRKKDHTFESDDYNKYVSDAYILVGHNKRGNGITTFDKHYKGFIEFNLRELRNIWDTVESINSAEIIFYTSDDDGDNFADIKTINLKIYNLELKPSDTTAEKLYQDMFKSASQITSISAFQSKQKKKISFPISTINKRMNYQKDWVAVGLECGTDIGEGKSGGVAIYSSGYAPTLKITYESNLPEVGKNYALFIEGGLTDLPEKGHQDAFTRTIKDAKNIFINQLGYEEGKNLRVEWFIKDGTKGHTKSSIRDSIVNFLGKYSTSESNCFIFMADHGSDGGKFYIGGTTDNPIYITPSELDGWLDQVNCKYMTVVIEACFSGDFIGRLRQRNRIIITSTDQNKYTFSEIPSNKGLFSVPFFNKLGEGASYGSAWEYADSKVDDLNYLRKKVGSSNNIAAWLKQNPKIDDSDGCRNYGNFLKNTINSNSLAKKVYPNP